MSPLAAGPPPVRGILFDYGFTLVTFQRPDTALERVYVEISRLLGACDREWVTRGGSESIKAIHVRLDRLVQAHGESGALEEFDLTRATADAYRGLGFEPGEALLDQIVTLEQEAWMKAMRVGPEVPGVLRRLHRYGIRVGLCSNAPYRPASLHAQLDHLLLAPLLDAATFSSEVGWRKPSAAMFGAALERLGTGVHDTVFVGDDVAADMVGAKTLGMRAVRLREHRDDRAANDPADAVIDRIDELPGLIARLRGG